MALNCLKDFFSCINDLLNHNLLHRSLQVLHYHYEPFIYSIKYVHNVMLYVLMKCTYMQDMQKPYQVKLNLGLVHMA